MEPVGPSRLATGTLVRLRAGAPFRRSGRNWSPGFDATVTSRVAVDRGALVTISGGVYGFAREVRREHLELVVEERLATGPKALPFAR